MRKEKGGWVYMLTSKRNGTLYVGVTADLARRMHEHQEKSVEGFTARYGVTRFVWYEGYDDIRDAIAREKSIKNWKRAWKIKRIEAMNPEWRDLWDDLNG